MEKIVVKGGQRLTGRVKVEGAKMQSYQFKRHLFWLLVETLNYQMFPFYRM